MPTYAVNKRAHADYEVLNEFEAGIVLTGQEVKSVRDGNMSLLGAYVTLAAGAARLIGSHVPRYGKARADESFDPDRSRLLLLHKAELNKIVGKMVQKGLTLVPLSVYTRGSKIKLKFALARGKKQFEKREQIKKRDLDRDIKRTFKIG